MALKSFLPSTAQVLAATVVNITVMVFEIALFDFTFKKMLSPPSAFPFCQKGPACVHHLCTSNTVLSDFFVTRRIVRAGEMLPARKNTETDNN